MNATTSEEINETFLSELERQFLKITVFLKRRNDFAKLIPKNPKKHFKKLININPKFNQENINFLELIHEDYTSVSDKEAITRKFLTDLSKIHTLNSNFELYTHIVTIRAEIYYGTWYSYASDPKGDDIRVNSIKELLRTIEFWKQLGNNHRILKIYDIFIDSLYVLNEIDQRLEVLNDYLNIAQILEDNERIAYVYRLLGDYFIENNSKKGFDFYYKSIDVYNILGMNEGVASIFDEIGDKYAHSEDYEQAEIAYKKSLKLYTDLKLIERAGWVSRALSRIYDKTQRDIYLISENIEKYLLSQLEPKQYWMCSLSTSWSHSGVRAEIDKLVEIYLGKDFEKEERIQDFFNKYLERLEKTHDHDILAHAYYSYGRILEEKSLKFDSEEFFKKALFLSEQMDFYPLTVKIYKLLGRNNQAMNQLEVSLDYFNKSLDIYKQYSPIPNFVELLFFEKNIFNLYLDKLSLEKEIENLSKLDFHLEDPNHKIIRIYNQLLINRFYSILGNENKSSQVMDLIINLLQEFNESKSLIAVVRTIQLEYSLSFKEIDNELLTEFDNVLDLWEELTNNFNSDVGWIYRNRPGRKSGINLMKSTLDIEKVLKMEEDNYKSYLSISRYYLLDGKLKEAEIYAEKSLNVISKNQHKDEDLSGVYHNIAWIFFLKREFEKSGDYFEKYFKLRDDKDKSSELISAIFIASYICIVTGKEILIKEYLKKVKEISI